ncbi:signal peptidase I [Telmatobacter sp. DSM 110680]|uniref:Signal peptidase I n=1 Tax=Telmatobacter sp. DSM 110680 TaxID=3036704 RepID=A0AAU7DSA4_9BACT
MTTKNTPPAKTPSEIESAPEQKNHEETPFEAAASICSVLVVGLFILTFLAQNFVIPSGSMEQTLLVGDHLVVDRVTLAPPTTWMPLVHYREPNHGDIVVFIKPGTIDAEGKPTILFLVKRLVGVPGDHIHLHNGIVYINGEEQAQPHAQPTTPANYQPFLDEFPSIVPEGNGDPNNGTPDSWANEFPSHVVEGDLVVPAGKFFMMGDNRHDSLDSRYWGFVPRENIIGRPLFNYWSFETPEHQFDETGVGNTIAWMGHVALHFFTDTRWKRTLHLVR